MGLSADEFRSSFPEFASASDAEVLEAVSEAAVTDDGSDSRRFGHLVAHLVAVRARAARGDCDVAGLGATPYGQRYRSMVKRDAAPVAHS